MTDTAVPLALHPDRLLPAGPGRAGDRAPALRRGARPAGHLAARPRRPAAAARRRAVPGPGDPVRHARPLRDPAAARRAACRSTRSASGRARSPRTASRAVWRRAVRALGRLPRHAGALLARGGAGGDLRRVGCGRRRETADAIYDQLAERLAQDAYRPRALYERFRHRGARHHRRPVRRPVRARRAGRRPDAGTGGSSRRSGPDRYLEPAQPGWADAVARLGEAADVDTGDYAGYVARAGGAAAATSSSTARPRPTTATPTSAPTRSSRPRPRGSTARRWPARRPRPRRVAFRRHMLLEMARMSCEDGLVMTLHPGVRRGHHAPDRRARSGPTPATTSRCASSSPTRCARCSSASARTRASTWSCSRSTRRCSRASSRRWPASTRRCTSARRGGSWTRPRRSGASARAVTETAGLLPHVRLRRRHARVLLDPGPPRHVAPPRRRRPRRAGRRAPARRGRGRRDGGRPRRPAARRAVFKL